MALFDNPDPFSQEEVVPEITVVAGGSNNDVKPEHGHDTINVPTAPTSDDSSDDIATQILTQSDGSEDHGSQQPEHSRTLDKLASAVNNVQSGVKEKAKSAAHKLHMKSIRATSVSKFLNPTVMRMVVRYDSDSESEGAVHVPKERELLWRARDSRKGRNSIAVSRLPEDDSDEEAFPTRFTPRMTGSVKEIAQTLWRMLTTFPYVQSKLASCRARLCDNAVKQSRSLRGWRLQLTSDRYWDMAFWSGCSYTLGSALFVATGVLSWLPLEYGDDALTPSAAKYGGPLTFFFGTLLYQVGAVAAYLEAVNDGSFHGSAMRRILEGQEDESKKLLDEKIHDFFRRLSPHRPHQGHNERAIDDMLVDPEAGWNTKELRQLRPGSGYPQGNAPTPRRGVVDLGGEEGKSSMYETWRWWPTWRALRSHHIYEMGWLACTIQLFGVTLYGVTGVVDLPGVLSSLQDWQKLGAFWVPQVVAALCFLIASIMFMLETQEKWWRPEPAVLGWWVGLWATIGSIGFELIAIFGIIALSGHEWADYNANLATIWGSAAYLISSALQWYEALNKAPLEELFGNSLSDESLQSPPEMHSKAIQMPESPEGPSSTRVAHNVDPTMASGHVEEATTNTGVDHQRDESDVMVDLPQTQVPSSVRLVEET